MRNIKRLLLALFLLALGVIVLFFMLENQQSVSLVLFGWAAPVVPVSALLLAALVIGLAVGPLLSAWVVLRAGRRGGNKVA